METIIQIIEALAALIAIIGFFKVEKNPQKNPQINKKNNNFFLCLHPLYKKAF